MQRNLRRSAGGIYKYIARNELDYNVYIFSNFNMLLVNFVYNRAKIKALMGPKTWEDLIFEIKKGITQDT